MNRFQFRKWKRKENGDNNFFYKRANTFSQCYAMYKNELYLQTILYLVITNCT